jgi:hypothetical protein
MMVTIDANDTKIVGIINTSKSESPRRLPKNSEWSTDAAVTASQYISTIRVSEFKFESHEYHF